MGDSIFYKRDDEKTKTGFPTYEAAMAALVKSGLPITEEDGEYRTRIRFRQRTGLYDLLVKKRTEKS
jgi:hypothetical protein